MAKLKSTKKVKKSKSVEDTKLSPIKERMNKSDITEFYVGKLMDAFEGKEIEFDEKFAKKLVKIQTEAFEELIAKHLCKGGIGQFTLPGLMTIKAVYKKGVKGGVEKPNPFKPGEMMITKDREPSVKVKVLGLKKLKDMALEGIATHKRLAKEKEELKAERKAAKEKAEAKSSKKTKKVKKASSTKVMKVAKKKKKKAA